MAADDSKTDTTGPCGTVHIKGLLNDHLNKNDPNSINLKYHIPSEHKDNFLNDFGTLVDKYGVKQVSLIGGDQDDLKSSTDVGNPSGPGPILPNRSDFIMMFSRGFSEHQYQDVLNSRVQVTYFVLDSLSVNADGSLTTTNWCIDVKDGKVTQHPSPNNEPGLTYVSVTTFAPEFFKKGVKYIGFDIVDSGWTNIQTIFNNALNGNNTAEIELYKNIGALIQATGVNTFDCDAEGNLSSLYVNVISKFFSQIYTRFGIETFTCSPPWLPNAFIDIAKQCYQQTGKPLIKWWNLQTYSGASGNTAIGWYQILLANDNYKTMGLTLNETKNFIKTIVSTGNDGGNQFPFTTDGSNIIDMINFLRGNNGNNAIGGTGIWQFFSSYDSNNASKNINWYELNVIGMIEGMKPVNQVSKFMNNYQGQWKCISNGKPSFNYTYSIFNDYLLIANNNGNNIRYCTISNILEPDGNGFTWDNTWTHKINPQTGYDDDSYDGGIQWQKIKTA